MESCCDIIDRLPSEAYSYLFGDRVNDFVQLRSLRSRVKAKIVKFDKLLQNETTPLPSASRPKPLSDYQPPPPIRPTPHVESDFDIPDEDMCPDLIDFLKLNEDERDSWGLSNDCKQKSLPSLNRVLFL